MSRNTQISGPHGTSQRAMAEGILCQPMTPALLPVAVFQLWLMAAGLMSRESTLITNGRRYVFFLPLLEPGPTIRANNKYLAKSLIHAMKPLQKLRGERSINPSFCCSESVLLVCRICSNGGSEGTMATERKK